MNKNRNIKTFGIILAVLIMLVAMVAVGCQAKTSAGAKTITIEIVNEGDVTTKQINTDEEFLRGALDRSEIYPLDRRSLAGSAIGAGPSLEGLRHDLVGNIPRDLPGSVLLDRVAHAELGPVERDAAIARLRWIAHLADLVAATHAGAAVGRRWTSVEHECTGDADGDQPWQRPVVARGKPRRAGRLAGAGAYDSMSSGEKPVPIYATYPLPHRVAASEGTRRNTCKAWNQNKLHTDEPTASTTGVDAEPRAGDDR